MFVTWVDPVWDSCWAHFYPSQQVVPLLPSHPLFLVSSLLFPVKSFKCWLFKGCVEKWNHVEDMSKLTVSTQLPFCAFAHGHQPRTDFREKRDVGFALEATVPFIPGNILRVHFSGVLAGGTSLSRSSSTEPWRTIL